MSGLWGDGECLKGGMVLPLWIFPSARYRNSWNPVPLWWVDTCKRSRNFDDASPRGYYKSSKSSSLSCGVQSPAVSASRTGKKQEPTPAAIGIRVHSGWGALVAISGKAEAVEVLERRRIEIIDPKVSGAAQPYHFAEKLEIREAEKHIEKCAAMPGTLAPAGARGVVSNLCDRGYSVVAATILLSSGRPF